MVAPSESVINESCLVWTGGQFSVLRALVGLLIGLRYLLLMPVANALIFTVDDQPMPSIQEFMDGAEHIYPAPLGYLPLALGSLLGIALAFGYRTRVVSLCLGLLFLAEVTEGFYPHGIAVPSLALLLLFCALQAPAPFGSLSACGRIDPRGDWKERRLLRQSLWVFFQLGGVLSAVTFLREFEPIDRSDPLWAFADHSDVSFWLRSWTSNLPASFQWWAAFALTGLVLVAVGLSLFAKTRFAAWCLFVGWHVVALGVLDLPMRCLAGMLVLLAMFDPNWLAPRLFRRPTRVFYDGDCGLCHRLVRLILAEDQSEDGFRFAPLRSRVFETEVSESQRADLPDSVAVLDSSGALSVRTAAVIVILDGLGGLWRLIAILLRFLPRRLADFGYDVIARLRKNLFAKPDGACPMIPPKLGERFEF